MPFTLSHAAAALPFRRTRLIISAVVVGSMAPDFAYFLELGHHFGFGHTLPGVFLLDLPLSFFVLWLFHRYAKQPLVSLLPRGARQRLDIGTRSISIHSASQFFLLALSILSGVATHLLWDSLTHSESWIVLHSSFLQSVAVLPLFGLRSYADILQYISSAAGIFILLLWSIHWYRTTAPTHTEPDRHVVPTDRVVITAALLIAIVVALVRAATLGLPDGVHGGQRFLTAAAVTAIPLFWLEVVIYGLLRMRRIPVHAA